MKIITFIVGLGPGGAEKYLLKLIKASKSKKNHTIVYLINPYYLDNFKELCSTMHIFEYLKIQMIKDMQYAKKRRIIYQGWMYHGMLFATILHIFTKRSKLIWCFRHSSPSANKKSTILIIKLLSFLSIFTKPILIFNSISGKKNHHSIFKNCYKKIVIFNGYSKLKNTKKSKINDNSELRLLSLNRWHPDKDLTLMLKSLRIVKNKGINFSLDMYGDKINYKNIELVKLINELSLKQNVSLCGLNKNIENIISNYDYHLLSSNADTFPNVICETMLLGLPNVVTDVGDCKEIVGKNGWVSPPSNVNLFAESIIIASKINGTVLYKRLSEKCIKRVLKNFSFLNSLEKFEEIWSKELS